MRSKWSEKYPINIPSQSKAILDRSVIDTEMLAEFRDATSPSSHSQNAVGSLISVLTNPGCPDNIARNISKTIVDSLNCPSILPRSHIIEEGLEIHPPFADLDSALSIIGIVDGIRISTSGLHRTPNAVNSGTLHTMHKASEVGGVLTKASTRSGETSPNAGDCDSFPVSTVAKTIQPNNSVTVRSDIIISESEDNESSESSSNYVRHHPKHKEATSKS
jgi:hypothetical protein